MTVPAAPPPVGRRPQLSSAVVMAAFIALAPPLFLLAPLLVLLLFSRPTTFREWFWIALAAAGTGMSATAILRHPADQATVIGIGAGALAVAFLIASAVLRGWSPVTRAGVSLIVATAAVFGWSSAVGVSMAQIDLQLEAAYREAITLALGTNPPAAQLSGALGTIPTLVRFTPGGIAFQALIGLGLAWRWYHQIAARPLPSSPAPFAEFRFPDPLVWGAIFTLALVLLPLEPPWARLAANALLVWAGLYATRGLAIAAAATLRWPLLSKILMAGLAVLAMPVAFGTLITLGLGDIWLDFRRRSQAPPFGGQRSNGSHSS